MSNHATTPPVFAVVGPTATGKSALAIELASRRGGEIVNADSMQLYRGMDIGTAKTPPAQRRVAHHLLDVLDVTQEATVAAYQGRSRQVMQEILDRGAEPYLVGGSGLYVRATLDALDFPGTDPQVRQRWEARGEAEGPGVLHRELERQDPAAAARIGARNTRRLVRALEVIELTGRPYSASLPEHTYVRPTLQLALEVLRPVLLERIEQRAHQMVADGLWEETRVLREEGLERGVTARRAVGYAQALAVLEGRISEQEGIEAIIVATRQLARRQQRWFATDPRIVWLDGQAPLADQVRAAERELARRLAP